MDLPLQGSARAGILIPTYSVHVIKLCQIEAISSSDASGRTVSLALLHDMCFYIQLTGSPKL